MSAIHLRRVLAACLLLAASISAAPRVAEAATSSDIAWTGTITSSEVFRDAIFTRTQTLSGQLSPATGGISGYKWVGTYTKFGLDSIHMECPNELLSAPPTFTLLSAGDITTRNGQVLAPIFVGSRTWGEDLLVTLDMKSSCNPSNRSTATWYPRLPNDNDGDCDSEVFGIPLGAPTRDSSGVLRLRGTRTVDCNIPNAIALGYSTVVTVLTWDLTGREKAPGTGNPTTAKPMPPASVKVKPKSAKSKLFVDVNPNKGKGYWRFQVQRQQADKTWKPLKSYKTKGSKETRTINLPKGTYRVVVGAKYGYAQATSAPVYLKK